MNKKDAEINLVRLKSNRKQIEKALFQVDVTNQYVVQMLVQRRQEIAHDIGVFESLMRK